MGCIVVISTVASRLRRLLWFWARGLYDLIAQALALLCAGKLDLICKLLQQSLPCGSVARLADRTHQPIHRAVV